MSPPPHQLAPGALSSSVPLQDEKNQVLITNAWLQLVGLLSPNTPLIIIIAGLCIFGMSVFRPVGSVTPQCLH